MTFGPNSNNPRERRSYAHTKIGELRTGDSTFDEARRAVDAASGSRKAERSDFETALLNAALGSRANSPESVVFIDWAGPGYSDTVFGGYAMTQEEAELWAKRHQNARSHHNSGPYNEIHGSNYPRVHFAAKPDESPNYQWGKGYSLQDDPANVRVIDVREPAPRA